MASEAGAVITLRDLLGWAAEQGLLTQGRSLQQFASSEELAAGVLSEAFQVAKDVASQRDLIEGFDTDLAGLDIRYICHDHGIRMPPWVVPLIGD